MVTPRLYAFSASTPQALEAETKDLAERLETGLPPRAVRRDLPYRRAVVATDPADAARSLRGDGPCEVFSSDGARARNIVFLFSGVGDQYPGMAAGLYRYLPRFREELDRCLVRLRSEIGTDLHAVLYPEEPDRIQQSGAGGGRAGAPDLAALFDRRASTQPIHRTRVAQPLAFATQYALARTFTMLGVAPTALVGYSVGEYVAACAAGVIRPHDALRLIGYRARLVDGLPPGAMLAVLAGPDAIAPYLADGDVTVAALDGPGLTVLAGPPGPVERAARRLADAEIACRRLATGHAFHSPMMAPVEEPLREALTAIPLHPPAIPFPSNVTGTWITDAEATDPAYWARHLSTPIRFAEALDALGGLARPVTIELGPGRTLTGLATHDGPKLRTLPGVFESRTDLEITLAALGRLWASGTDLAWSELRELP
ncbi:MULTISPECIES: acyltransferase domain-containing protein [Actinomadura]|uniref:Acyltransferase domain-containing protein n=1 Tax=Actinomadura yumaensis TaxID=111807 RepID=A0ABW2CDL5_9ACTN|nr:acyltransferase domain-containing protein [Actinomadura sp. J1-007]MWK38150.1 acyltransferase domain-containing protein [Actinomadura sp. J1-007]